MVDERDLSVEHRAPPEPPAPLEQPQGRSKRDSDDERHRRHKKRRSRSRSRSVSGSSRSRSSSRRERRRRTRRRSRSPSYRHSRSPSSSSRHYRSRHVTRHRRRRSSRSPSTSSSHDRRRRLHHRSRSPPPRHRHHHHHHHRRDRSERDRRETPPSRHERLAASPSSDTEQRLSPSSSSPQSALPSNLTQLEREKRTVFVGQLAARLKERELREFFEQAGKVRDVRIIMDRISRRSKGVGYVEFFEESSVQKALSLNNQRLLGIPVIVQPSEAEKNRVSETTGSSSMAEYRLYVGSIHFNLTEDDLRQVFEPFGPLEYVNLQRDAETGRSKGFAFIQYKSPNDARMALDRMNGVELFGRTIKVGLVADRYQSGGGGGTASGGGNLSLDDGEMTGMALTSQSRAELMAKLARDQPAKQAIKKREEVQATRCVLLVNMFNPAEETEEDWEKEIQEDVKQECQESYGNVVHAGVNKDSQGHVYIKFDNNLSSQKALKALNGRWFNNRQISASFLPEMAYNSIWPDAAFL